MGWLIAAFCLLLLVVLWGKFQKTDYPYQKQKALFSPAERSFLGALERAIGKNAKIFGKVRIADVVTPKPGLSRSRWQSAFNRISRKHFDFVLCRKSDLSVLCAIELDDRSHRLKQRQKRDHFVSGVCRTAGLPMIQVPARSFYAVNELRQLIWPYLGRGSN